MSALSPPPKNFRLAAAAENNSGLAVFFLGLATETEFG